MCVQSNPTQITTFKNASQAHLNEGVLEQMKEEYENKIHSKEPRQSKYTLPIKILFPDPKGIKEQKTTK